MTAKMLIVLCLALLVSSAALLVGAWRTGPTSRGHLDRETATLFGVICWSVGVAMVATLFLVLLLAFGVTA